MGRVGVAQCGLAATVLLPLACFSAPPPFPSFPFFIVVTRHCLPTAICRAREVEEGRRGSEREILVASSRTAGALASLLQKRKGKKRKVRRWPLISFLLARSRGCIAETGRVENGLERSGGGFRGGVILDEGERSGVQERVVDSWNDGVVDL